MMDKRPLDCAAPGIHIIYGYCIRILGQKIEVEDLVCKGTGVFRDSDLPKMLIWGLDMNRRSNAFW